MYQQIKISVSRSPQQECPFALLLYIIQNEPMACTIRADPDIEGIKLLGVYSVTENKISMFANDTQLYRHSFENSFKYL